jgi:hypothetical protein
VVWGEVCQRNILLVSAVGCLKIEHVFIRTVSISDELVSVLMDTISAVFGLKLCHGWKGVGFSMALLFWKFDIPHRIL